MSHTASQLAIRQFSNVILTSINPEIKRVCYLGIAEGIIAKLDLSDTEVLNRGLFVRIVDELGEIYVIDKPYLVDIVCKVVDSRCTSKERKAATETNSYLDFLGISGYLTTEDLNNVNQHYSVFLQAFTSTVNLLPSESDGH